jgi:hypothetical protein
MKRKHLLAGAGLAITLCAVLVACGGGSSSGSTASTSSSQSSTTASGTLSAFGSVFVNGTEYAVSASTSVVDGDADDAASSASALLVGMRLDVSATDDTAGLLRYTSAVRGNVDAIDTANSTLTVLGQTVVVGSGTAFSGSKTSGSATTTITGLSNVAVGDYVVVYGYNACTSSTSTSSCTGGVTQILASLVYEPGSTGIYRVEGYAENVDATTRSFTINGLTVDYTVAGSNCTPTPCAVSAGDFLAVRSSTAPTSSGGALSLVATSIVTATQAPVLVAGATASLEGAVLNLSTSADTFTLRGIVVDGSALASTVAALSDGQIVEVTGTVSSTGTIVATAITVEQKATFTLTAPLSAESASADTLVVLGQTFTVNSSTHFVDRSKNVRPFNLSNFATVLSVGDQLVVSGYTGSSGNIATRVVRVATPTTAVVAVQGVVTADSSSGDTLTVGGVTVTLNSSTVLATPGSTTTTLATFFSEIVPGTTVATAIGTAGSSSGTMTASEAGLMSSNCEWATGAY